MRAPARAAPEAAPPSLLGRHRLTLALVLGVVFAWLVYVVVAGQRNGRTFAVLLEGLGGELPAITRSFFATYRWWWLLAVAYALLAVDVVRRRSPPPRYFAIVLATMLLTAFGLLAWMYEAVFQPLTDILEKIG
jgi:hypothetical protein